jgi:hypothetical protein
MGNDQLKSPAANSMGTEKLQLWIHMALKRKGMLDYVYRICTVVMPTF